MRNNILHAVLASCALMLVSSTLLFVACNQGKAAAAQSSRNKNNIIAPHVLDDHAQLEVKDQI